MRSKHLSFLVVIILCLSLKSNSYSQISKKTNELNVSGAFVYFEFSTSYLISCNYGYFITNTSELGCDIDILEGEESVEGYLNLYYSKHFPKNINSTQIPYFGCKVGVGTLFGSTIVGLFGGMKFFVNKGGAISIESFYNKSFEWVNTGSAGVLTGISIFF